MLDKKKLVALLRENYDCLKEELIIEKYHKNICVIISNEKRYVLKKMGGNVNDNTLKKIQDACKRIRQCGLDSPSFINTIKGSPFFRISGELYVLYMWIEGETLKLGNIDNEQRTELSLRYADVLQALSKMKKIRISSGFLWDVKSIRKQMEFMNNLKNQTVDSDIKDALEWKIYRMKCFTDEDYLIGRKVTWANTHGDYHIGQAVFFEKKIRGIIDLDCLCRMPIIYELINCYFSTIEISEMCNCDIAELVDFIAAFCTKFRLTADDMRQGLNLYEQRLITSTYPFVMSIMGDESFRDKALLNISMAKSLQVGTGFNDIYQEGIKRLEN